MTFKEYCRLDRMNWSSLKNLVPKAGGSPKLFDWRRDHPMKDRPAFALGRAGHCAVLEPHVFEDRYQIATGSLPDGWEDIWQAHVSGRFAELYTVYDGAVRRGNKWNKFEVEHWADDREVLLARQVEKALSIGRNLDGREMLSRDHYETAQAIGEAVANSPASALLVGGEAEKSVTWTDPETGIGCKCRADYLSSDLVDLKTARRVDPFGFQRDAGNYLYHGQMAFYFDGCVEAGLIKPDAKVFIIAAQSGPPFDVGVYLVFGDELDAGRRLYRRCLETYQECTSRNEWPGAVPEQIDLKLPYWAAGMEDENVDADGLDWSD